MNGVSAQFSAGQMVRNHASLEAPSSPSVTDSEVLLSVCSVSLHLPCLLCLQKSGLPSLEATVEAWRTHMFKLGTLHSSPSSFLHGLWCFSTSFYPGLIFILFVLFYGQGLCSPGDNHTWKHSIHISVQACQCFLKGLHVEPLIVCPQPVPETVLSSRKAPKTQPLGYSSLNLTPSPGVSQTHKQVLRREELCCIIFTKSRSVQRWVGGI